MRETDRHADTSKDCDFGAAADAAESIRREFGELIDIFERQLSILPKSDEERPHFAGARSAAERGLKLSRNLIERLKAESRRQGGSADT